MEPLRWTPYMNDCVRVLREEREINLDLLLILQSKCYITVAQMICPHAEWAEESKPPGAYFIKAMQMQLQDIRQNLPADMQTDSQYWTPF